MRYGRKKKGIYEDRSLTSLLYLSRGHFPSADGGSIDTFITYKPIDRPIDPALTHEK